MARLTKQFESGSEEQETPDELFLPLHHEFRFTMDVAASSKNTKCKNYISKRQNGLVVPWKGVCWCNPPYGRGLDNWMSKANDERTRGVTTVCLIPARTNTNWFHEICVRFAEIRFVRGRPKFGGADTGLPWPLLIIVFKAKRARS